MELYLEINRITNEVFIDSADIEAIEKFTKSGMVDGVTTNPSIIAKSGKDFKDVIKEICSITQDQ